jgi:hypothetical protein
LPVQLLRVVSNKRPAGERHGSIDDGVRRLGGLAEHFRRIAAHQRNQPRSDRPTSSAMNSHNRRHRQTAFSRCGSSGSPTGWRPPHASSESE